MQAQTFSPLESLRLFHRDDRLAVGLKGGVARHSKVDEMLASVQLVPRKHGDSSLTQIRPG